MTDGENSYRLFLEGDKSAFDGVLHEYLDSLVFFADRYVHDIYAAEDIAVEAFTYLLANPKKYSFKSSLKTYLFTVCRSRAIDYIRRRGRAKQAELDEAETADFRSLEETVIKNEEKRALSKAIEALPGDMKAALHLVYFEELSYEEAAAVLRKNKKQISNLLYRAKILLKDSFTKGEFGL